MTDGQVIQLTGTSSAAKSTLARALPEHQDQPLRHVNWDCFWHVVEQSLPG